MNDGESPIKTFFRNKIVLFILVLDFCFVVSIIVLKVMMSDGSSIINLNIVPTSASISINGQSGYSNGEYRFAPGDYVIVASYDGMNTKTINVKLDSDSIVNASTFLSSGKDFDYYKLKKNYSDFLALSGIAAKGSNTTIDDDHSAEEFIAEFKKAYNLYMKELPIEYFENAEIEGKITKTKEITIRINKDEECKKTLCLKVLMLNTKDEGFANSLLTEKGFKLEDYEIYYEFF